MLTSEWATQSNLEGIESFALLTMPRARGPALRIAVEQNMNGIQSPTDSLFTLCQITAHVNLWAFNFKQEKILVAIALCSRVLDALTPILLVTRSQKTNHLLRTGAFALCLRPSPEMQHFLDGSTAVSDNLLDGVLDPISFGRAGGSRRRSGLLPLGTTTVVQSLPSAGNHALAIALLNKGYAKYDPAVLDLVLEVATLVSAKIALAHRTVCEQLVEYGNRLFTNRLADRLGFLRAARLRTEQVALDTGIEPLLRAARDRLVQAVSALDGVRQLVVKDCRDKVDANAEYTRCGAAALMGIENRVEKLSFEGAPDASWSNPARVLDSLYNHHGVLPGTILLIVSSNSLNLPRHISQMLDLFAQERRANLDGLTLPLDDCPAPDGASVGSREWVPWFLSAKEGTTMARLALKYGWTGGRARRSVAREPHKNRARQRRDGTQRCPEPLARGSRTNCCHWLCEPP